jgi:hypothetical protein
VFLHEAAFQKKGELQTLQLGGSAFVEGVMTQGKQDPQA